MSEENMIFIGGITGGIGSALARHLQAEGHLVAGYARDAERAEAFQKETGIKVLTGDATDPAALQETFDAATKELGRIDAYVHAIGSIYLKPAHLTPDEDWHETLTKNLSSAFYALRCATKIMQKQGTGACLFFSTAAAQTGIANHEAIAAAKGGVEALVRSAAATYASKGVRINAIAPSLTNTPLAKPIVGSEQALEFSKRMHPLGDITQPEDVASLGAWLISDAGRFVTGQTYVIDGGLSTIVPKPKA